MIRLIAFGETFDIDGAYKAGARAAREAMALHSNPFSLQERRHKQWRVGFENEGKLVHVVEGLDIINAVKHASRTFTATYTVDPDRFPKAAKLHYAISLMKASGMLVDTAELRKTNPGITAAQLRKALASTGHHLSIDFAGLILRRADLDRCMTEASLMASELRIVEKLTPIRRNLLTALADLQDRYFDTMVQNGTLAKRLGQAPTYATGAARSIKRDGLEFLFRFAGTRCSLTPKGWAAVRLLAHNAALDAAPTPDFAA